MIKHFEEVVRSSAFRVIDEAQRFSVSMLDETCHVVQPCKADHIADIVCTVIYHSATYLYSS
jgi:NRPS condensation-like uncharacterized protein